MLKVAGMFLLTGGAFGFALCLCREQKRQIDILKEIKYMYELLQGEISYTGMPLPQIFLNVSKNLKPPLGDLLHRVGEKLGWEQGKELLPVWEKEAKETLRETPLTGKQKDFLLQFSGCVGIGDRKGQAKALERNIGEVERYIRQMEEEEKNKTRLIMSLGTAGGLLLSILLM